jgi:hypothetical protein
VNDFLPDDLRVPEYKPTVVHQKSGSIEDLLRCTYPVPDAEGEEFVATIYADREESRNASQRQ